MAAIAVAIAAYAGLSGLARNPVKGSDASGLTTISGSFEPFGCGSGCVQGYVQAGARSVFVIFPTGCVAPAREAEITVTGRLDRSQGKATYRLSGCVATS
jgi:hypothetical protein